MLQPARPAVFLDRDGVIIENRAGYVRTWEDVEIFPQALAALARLSQSRLAIVIVTNQSAVGRGLMSLETAAAINRRLVEIITKAGGRVDGIYLCPHAPQDNCDCRKPRPGLLQQAAAGLNLDLPASTLIGDALSDMQAGQAAGVGRCILVRTGRGAQQEHLPLAAALPPFEVCDDLSAAVGLVGM